MKVVLIEDEIAASENLKHLLNSVDPTIDVTTVLTSVKTSVAYFSEENDTDLILMDIHLADGISFEIFDQVEIKAPIIFTTAYDHYAIKAFKVNSIDYLLKPINEEELREAILKFKERPTSSGTSSSVKMEDLLKLLQAEKRSYRSSYLVSLKDELIPVKTEDIAYFYIDAGLVHVYTIDRKNYIVDKKLEDIENELDPAVFERVNRQYIINKNAIANIKHYFGGKLIVNTKPPTKDRVIVSKAKASSFKNWMNS